MLCYKCHPKEAAHLEEKVRTCAYAAQRWPASVLGTWGTLGPCRVGRRIPLDADHPGMDRLARLAGLARAALASPVYPAQNYRPAWPDARRAFSLRDSAPALCRRGDRWPHL